jgi:hypothetical protein
MALKLAFMAIVPGADPQKHRSVITTEFAELTTQIVGDKDQAVTLAKQLADEGCAAIELCGGFGQARPPSALSASICTRCWVARAATRYFKLDSVEDYDRGGGIEKEI